MADGSAAVSLAEGSDSPTTPGTVSEATEEVERLEGDGGRDGGEGRGGEDGGEGVEEGGAGGGGGGSGGDDTDPTPRGRGDVEAAERYKKEGNAHFKAGRFEEAVVDYSNSLEAHEQAAVLGNRAFAYLKLEDFGYAIMDATRALVLDPGFVKAHYRRGSAYMALGKFKDAKKDLVAVVKLLPSDKGARARLKECEKQIRRIAFEKAIHTDETASIWDKLDVEAMEIPPTASPTPSLPPLSREDYPTHPKSPTPPSPSSTTTPSTSTPSAWGVSLEFCRELKEFFREQKRLPTKTVFQILDRARACFQQLPTLIRPCLAEEEAKGGKGDGRKFTIVGDTHGQYYDLLHILDDQVAGEPSPSNPILFNGDFVDRGPFSLEVVLLLFAYKLALPDSVHLLRGNHETVNMNRMYGFEGEVGAKVSDSRAMELFTGVFRTLPLAAVVGGKVFVAHGGIFARDGVTLSDVEAIDRFKEPPEGGGDMSDLMWSDPQPFPGRGPSKRGVGKSFGPDITAKFLEENGLSLLVRSHEVKDEGYLVEHNGKCITVFSAPNYCDSMGNKGAVVTLDQDCKPSFVQFKESPHPPARPMQYATGLAQMMGMG